jgi:hypothetical protein
MRSGSTALESQARGWVRGKSCCFCCYCYCCCCKYCCFSKYCRCCRYCCFLKYCCCRKYFLAVSTAPTLRTTVLLLLSRWPEIGVSFSHHSPFFFPIFGIAQLLQDRRGGRPESSLSPLTWGGAPSPLLAPGRVTSSRQLFGVYPVLLGRRCYVERVVFNHLSESLNPFIRSFRRRLRRWCWWHGFWSVETTSYVYVIASEYVSARLRRH